MSAPRRLVRRLFGLVRPVPSDAEIDEELRFHLESLERRYLRQGASPAEARRRAALALGGLDQTRERCRDERSVPMLDEIRSDVRFAWRTLRQSPVFAGVAVLTLALGIGAVSAIAIIVRDVLIAPLPYPEPDRLVRVFESSRRNPRFPVSPGNFPDYRRGTRAFTQLAAWTREDLQLAADDRPERIRTLRVTTDYFPLLGARPALGRTLLESEMRGDARAIVLSHDLWTRRFGADPAIVGAAVRLSGETWTVVGVMPAGLEHVGGDYRSLPHGETVDAWRPVALDPDSARRNWHFLNVVGRLAPGVTMSDAKRDLDRIAADLERRFPDTNTGWRLQVTSLRDEIVGPAARHLVLLLAAVGCVLLIACANVSSLLLARATSRRREFAVRAALGASRRRLLQQALTESVVLAAAGGLAGLALTLAGVPLLVRAMPADFPRLHAIQADWSVIGLIAAVSGVTALLFGVMPALQQSLQRLAPGLREQSAASGTGRRTLLARHLLVVGEVGLAFALLVASALLLRSLWLLQRTDAGFSTDRVITFGLALPETRYEWPDGISRFYEELMRRVRTVPGVEAAGAATALPWTGWDENTGFAIIGNPDANPQARFGAATPGFLEALKVPLLEGRRLHEDDRRGRPKVVVVNHAFASRFFPEGGAVGARLNLWDDETTIVGVVADIKDRPADAEAEPAFYWPQAQQPFGASSVAVRTTGDLVPIVDAIRRELRALDPELPIADLRPLEDIAAAAHAQRRFLLVIVGSLAALALVLAGVGTYGLLAYSVEQRRRELGIRAALGASRRQLLGLVFRQGVRLCAAGLILGASVAALLARLAAGLLYGITPADPPSISAALAAMAVAAGLACYVPARRAAAADPARMLRVDQG